MGEAAEIYARGTGDWKIGEDVYTPQISNDALRYMYAPTKDGHSADYYPDVFPSNCAAYANCDPHYTSGIGNLAFYLMCQGGAHPRGKTNVVVPAIGIKAAQQIWYRALTAYMISTTDYAEARNTMVHAASDLFGDCSSPVTTVNKAWDAVGVPNRYDTCYFNIIKNGGFEALSTISSNYGVAVPSGQGWSRSGGVDFTNQNPPHSGSYLAAFGTSGCCSTGTLYQIVTIPATAKIATLSYWLRIDTTDPPGSPALDTLTARLKSSDATMQTTLSVYSNRNANGRYAAYSFDVTAYRGKTVYVIFDLTENTSGNYSTAFLLDDAALLVE